MGALIFGDSYVAAADNGRPGYARLLPLLMLMRGQHMGLGGTGFVRASGERQPYGSRLADLLTRDADTVIIQATGNDATCDLGEVQARTKDFLTGVTARFPRVIVVGPMWAKDGSERLPELRDRTADVCEELGIQFVDALGWLSPKLIGPDGAHPTWLGHAVIAFRIAHEIR